MRQLPPPSIAMPANRINIAAWLLAGATLVLILAIHLLPALLAGLLVYELVHLTAPLLQRHLTSQRAKLVAVGLLAVAMIAAVVLAVMGIVAIFRSDAGSMGGLMGKLAEIVEKARASLPDWASTSLPTGADALKDLLVHWLREHAGELQLAGKHTARGLVHVLIGLVIGAILALREATAGRAQGRLAMALAERAQRVAEAFRRVVFAQVRISAINTTLTGIYLLVVLPLFGVDLPLTKTMIAITFVVGLLPVIGNLVSNTVIVVVSLSHSPEMGLVSLGYLVVIHKLEYFLNARIVGNQISAHAWELLLAMLTMEAAFGLPGVIAAPVYYAYLKDELKSVGLV